MTPITDQEARKLAEETYILSVTEEIWKIMERNQMSKADMARSLKCSKAHVTQLLNGGRNMTLRTLSNICTVLGVVPATVFITNPWPLPQPPEQKP